MREFDVVVLGAGAAGLMCAFTAGQRGRRTLLLDHADRVGSKILISGGGRANFTNLHTTHENFLSENPHFARSALSRFTPADMIALVRKHGVPYHEKTLGQLFCDRSARDLVTLLVRECELGHVTVETGTKITSVARSAEDTSPIRFNIETTRGTLRAHSLVVATGGLSIPKLGATGLGYDLARQFGLRVVEPRPALVPLTLGEADCSAWCDLAGVSAEVVAAAAATGKAGRGSRVPPAFREKMLFTHRGLSGPAILQISSYIQPGGSLTLDFAPGQELVPSNTQSPADRNPGAVLDALRAALPGRLAERLLPEILGGASARKSDALSNAVLAEAEERLHGWKFHIAGTEGFSKAEVTAGGVDTAELVAKTLESRKVPGLYFIGEVVDVTGWLGGYNFQWAWASGFCAGEAA